MNIGYEISNHVKFYYILLFVDVLWLEKITSCNVIFHKRKHDITIKSRTNPFITDS